MAIEASQQAERRALEFEIASREAELRALRAQIHPHFLFNSLNSINALIAARPEEARQLCVRLADFLRRSLTLGSREAIPLAEELDLAEQLLSIEKVRFGERLNHEIVADDDGAGLHRAAAPPPAARRERGHPRHRPDARGRARSASRPSGAAPSCGSRSRTRATPTPRTAQGRRHRPPEREAAPRSRFTADAAEVHARPDGDVFRVELRLPATGPKWTFQMTSDTIRT